MSSFPAALLRTMRPYQWVKNVFVLAPMVFAQQAAEPGIIGRVLGALAIFCALSSAVYLINDIADREADRRHPTKRNRPIAAGELPVAAAATAAILMAGISLAVAVWLQPAFAGVAAAYFVMNLGYSMGLKRVVILDVMLVASGFLLRAWAGALVIQVDVSRWLVMCTGLIALFLGFVKRRQEIAMLEEGAEHQRPILREYSLPFLDQMIGIATAGTVLAYSLYAFSPEVADKLGTEWLGLTIPFVVFGIFRYLYLVHQRGRGQNPTALILGDLPLLATIFLWGGTVLLALYLR